MPNMSVKGLDDLVSFMKSLEGDVDGILKAAVYDGANVLAEEIRKGIERLPIESRYVAKNDDKLEGITKEQKDGLLEGFGISPFRKESGYINQKIGFAGYNKTKTVKYPQGQPNALIARSIESGSSVRQKRPFVRPAVNRAKARAVAAVQAKLDDEIKKLSKENNL